MKFSTRDDIEAPIQEVFAALADFEYWERAAMRRGAEVSRTDKSGRMAVGAGWDTRFRFRGKDRQLTIELTEMDSPGRLAFAADAKPVSGTMTIDLLELSPRRTRLNVGSEIKPKTLGARLVLQSLKLAKAKMDKRFHNRVSALCKDIEARLAASRRA